MGLGRLNSALFGSSASDLTCSDSIATAPLTDPLLQYLDATSSYNQLPVELDTLTSWSDPLLTDREGALMSDTRDSPEAASQDTISSLAFGMERDCTVQGNSASANHLPVRDLETAETLGPVSHPQSASSRPIHPAEPRRCLEQLMHLSSRLGLRGRHHI